MDFSFWLFADFYIRLFQGCHPPPPRGGCTLVEHLKCSQQNHHQSVSQINFAHSASNIIIVFKYKPISAEGAKNHKKTQTSFKLTFTGLINKANGRFWHSLLWALGTNGLKSSVLAFYNICFIKNSKLYRVTKYLFSIIMGKPDVLRRWRKDNGNESFFWAMETGIPSESCIFLDRAQFFLI